LLDRLKQLFAEAKTAPLTPEPIAPAAHEDPTEPESRQDRRKKKRINAQAGTRVLIVDDSPTIVALLSRMLKQNHYLVLEAGDGESALEIARKERPGLIFLDIVLPGMSGFTALRTLRHDPVTKDIPIIMISGNAQATEQFYVQRIGADNFMKKPFSRAEVFTYIERLLDENFVPRRFNTFVHDTTLEPETEEAEEQVAATSDLDGNTAAETTAPAAETVTATSAVEIQADAPVVETGAVPSAAEPAPAAPVAAATAASPEPAATAPITPVAESPATEHPQLSFAEMVEALLESSDASDGAQSDSSPAPPTNEAAPAPASTPEPPPRDIFADINAGWRRPVHRPPPPG
jgi:twitching motility two-component system response regulator PilH